MTDKTYEKLLPFFQIKGLSLNQIAKRTGLARSTIQSKYQMFVSCIPIEETKGVGRPRKLNNADYIAIGQYIRADKTQSIENLQYQLKNKRAVNIGRRTLARNLAERGYKKKRAKKSVLLTTKHKEKRLIFCRNNRNRDWKNIIFSDETCIEVGVSSALAWSKNGRRQKLPAKKFPNKVMVWGAITYDKKLDLRFISGSLNGEGYQGILTTSLLPFLKEKENASMLFMQDNAPCHKSKSTMSFLERKNVQLLDWPANSPDLNPIENVWSLLKREVAKSRASSRDELQTAIRNAWDRIDQNVIRSLFDSMPRRITS